jgi:penicillin-binding protein 1B
VIEQTTYDVGGQEYTPRNFEGEYHGQVTARYALMRSLNNATIGLAGMVGFDRVASLARDAGIKSARGTPAVAIGAYDATPLDMAGAYTAFANHGLLPGALDAGQHPHLHGRRRHRLLARLQAGSGPARGLPHHQPDGECDAGHGTGAGVRGMGFTARRPPAKPAPATTPGLPASPPICCASSGWATTTTAT